MTTSARVPSPAIQQRCDDKLIWDVLLTPFLLPCLTAAHETRLFDELARTPRTAEQLADQLGFDRRAVDAVSGTLVGLGLLKRVDGKLHLTSLAHTYLDKDSPYYVGPALERVRDRPFTHSGLVDILRKADPPERPLTDGWKHGKMGTDLALRETAFHDALSRHASEVVAEQGGFEGVSCLLDVGGGSGRYVVAIARRYPDMTFTLLDLPEVCGIARQYFDGVEAADVGPRVRILDGDMFSTQWPQGHDGVLISNVLHDWPDRTCEELCQRAFDALPSGGRIFVHEMLLDDAGDGPLAATAYSVWMLFATAGRQFRITEITAMLEKTGFTNVAATPTLGYYTLLSANKPE